MCYLDGATPTRLGPKPLKSALVPSVSIMCLMYLRITSPFLCGVAVKAVAQVVALAVQSVVALEALNVATED